MKVKESVLSQPKPLQIYLYNTEARKILKFVPKDSPLVRMYSCGPTVYDYTHLGHARTYILTDILRRVLEFAGYKVKQVMNITDVGHLTTDDDLGHDKLMKAYYREKKKKKDITIWDVIEYYTEYFLKTLEELNILPPDIMPRATEHVDEMIKIIKTLLEKGYAYKTSQAVYFHVPKFKGYTRLFPQALDEKIVGARAEVNVDSEKKHPADFRLWQLDQPNHILQWDTPWGKGFPGWHIECSAMSMKYLGDTLDIHTGGEDHIFPHHTNEMAQSEAYTGKQFVRYWIHFYHLLVDGRKMSKSLKNFYTLEDIKKRGFLPEHLRYLVFLSHYRKRLNFTWKALESAKKAYENLIEHYLTSRSIHVISLYKNLKNENKNVDPKEWLNLIENDELLKLFTNERIKPPTYAEFEKIAKRYKVEEEFKKYFSEFIKKITDDLMVPEALSVLWKGIRDQETNYKTKLLLLALINRVLGLRFLPLETVYERLLRKSPEDAIELADQGLQVFELKAKKDWDRVDAVKAKLQRFGRIKDIVDYKVTVVIDDQPRD